MTASSSASASGTACSWVSWATSPAVDHPPPVSAQKPVWRPGARWPKATRSQSPVRPAAQAGQGGSMPRAAQPEHRLDHHPGARRQRRAVGARSPSSSSVPTTSWPGTNGKLTRCSK